MKRPLGVTVVAILAIVGGVIQLLGAFGYLGLAWLKTSLFVGIVSGLSPAMMLGTGVLSLVVGVLGIAFGIGALSMKSWAWLTGVILWAVSLVFSVLQMTVTGLALVPVLAGIIAIAIIAYLSSAPVREAFGIHSDHYTTQHPSAV